MLAPGLRLGWISAVRPIVDQLAMIKQQVDPHTQNLSQLVVCELVERGVFDRHLVTLQAEHRRRRDALVQALRHHVRGRPRFAVPDGGMYLWCQLESHVSARAVQEHALRESVAIVTGEPFYVDQGGASQLRLCYTSQAPACAGRVAQTLARSLAAAGREPRRRRRTCESSSREFHRTNGARPVRTWRKPYGPSASLSASDPPRCASGER